MVRLSLILIFLKCVVYADTFGSVSGNIPLPKQKKITVPISKYRGKISGNIAPNPPVVAAVWLESDSISAPKKPKEMSLAQTNYQFDEFLIIVAKGTTVYFPNNDPDYHNIYSLSKAKKFDIGRYNKVGLVKLNCEIHDHMKANIVVVDSPYYVTSNTKGEFSLSNIPSGDYTLKVLIDSKTTITKKITVSANKNTLVPFQKS